MPPASGAGAGDRVVTVTPNQGGTIRLQINAPTALRTQAAQKVYADIDHLTVKLKRKSDNSLVEDKSPVATNGTTTHVVFNNVSTGVTYYLEIDAIDVNGFSIAKTSPTKSADIPVTATTTTNVSVNLPLQDGGGAALNFTFTSPTYFTATNYLIWLTNAATGALVTSYKSTTDHPSMTGVTNGNYIAWAAAIDDTANKIMTPVKQLGAVTVAGGAVTAPVGGTFNVSFGNTVTQVATNGSWSLVGLGVDSAVAAYGVDSASSQVLKVASTGAMPTAVVGNGVANNATGDGSASALGSVISIGAGNPAGLTVDGSGNIFAGDTTNLKLRMIPNTTIAGGGFGFTPLTGGQIYTIATVAAGPRGIGTDAGGTVYWTDNTSVYKRKPNGAAQQMTVLPAPAILNGLAVDKVGNVFAGQRFHVYMYVATAGTYFGVDQTAAVGTWVDLPGLVTAGNTYRNIAVGPLGNLYVADFLNQSVWCLDAMSGTKYRVVGTGAATGSLISNGGTPTSASTVGVLGVAVGPAGELFFTTTNTIWRCP